MECPRTGPCLGRVYCLPKTTLSIFSIFRERLAEACRIRNMTESELCSGTGMGGQRALELHAAGPQAMDIYRLGQIADGLNVSIDWLLGRSEAMELPPVGKKKAAKKSVAQAAGRLAVFRVVVSALPSACSQAGRVRNRGHGSNLSPRARIVVGKRL
jgi:transcriptional regulator with XRE-family HTH domain